MWLPTAFSGSADQTAAAPAPLVRSVAKVADVVNRFDRLDLEAGLPGHLKALPALMAVPLVCVTNSHPTFSADDFDDLGDIGRKLDGRWEDDADSFSSVVGKPQVVGDHATIKIDVRVLVDGYMLKLLAHKSDLDRIDDDFLIRVLGALCG